MAVRALLTATPARRRRRAPCASTGTFRPARGGVPLVLQRLRGGGWTTVARTHTTARSTFSLVYTAPAGALHLRVRFAGDAQERRRRQGAARSDRALSRRVAGRFPRRGRSYFTRIFTRSDFTVAVSKRKKRTSARDPAFQVVRTLLAPLATLTTFSVLQCVLSREI